MTPVSEEFLNADPLFRRMIGIDSVVDRNIIPPITENIEAVMDRIAAIRAELAERAEMWGMGE